jgi:hypothetical protein
MEILSKSTGSKIKECRQKFAAARPFRHVVIDDFFVQEFAERLLENFPAVDDPATLLNEFGVPNPKSCISDLKSLGGIYEQFDRYIQSPDFLRYVDNVISTANCRSHLVEMASFSDRPAI